MLASITFTSQLPECSCLSLNKFINLCFNPDSYGMKNQKLICENAVNYRWATSSFSPINKSLFDSIDDKKNTTTTTLITANRSHSPMVTNVYIYSDMINCSVHWINLNYVPRSRNKLKYKGIRWRVSCFVQCARCF